MIIRVMAIIVGVCVKPHHSISYCVNSQHIVASHKVLNIMCIFTDFFRNYMHE